LSPNRRRGVAVCEVRSSLALDNVPATDPSGFSRLANKVDFHSWSLLKGIALSTTLGVGPNLSPSGESDLVNAIRASTQQNAARGSAHFEMADA
jgi:type IV secretion system protein VirB10